MEKSKFQLTIKPTLLLFFMGIVFIASCIMITMQYISNKELAKEATSESFMSVAEHVKKQLETFDFQSEHAIELIKIVPEANTLPIPNKPHKLLKVMTKNIEFHPYIYSFYMGHKNGEFYQIINLNIIQDLRKRLDAPKKARWIVVKIKKNGTKYEEFLDEKLNLISTKKSKTDYIPASRPWFKRAQKSEKMTKTQPYEFTSLRELGVTYSKKYDDTTIIGLDIAIQSLNEVLNQQNLVKGSEAFLFKNQGRVMAYTKYGEHPFNEFTHKQSFYSSLFDHNKYAYIPEKMTILGVDYYKYFVPLQNKYSSTDYLAIISPIDSLMQPYNKEIINSILISLILLMFVSTPFILYFVGIIVQPIQAIGEESKKINDDNMEKVQYNTTFISELDQASKSMFRMSNYVKDHKTKQKTFENSYLRLVKHIEEQNHRLQTEQNQEIDMEEFHPCLNKHASLLKQSIDNQSQHKPIEVYIDSSDFKK